MNVLYVYPELCSTLIAAPVVILKDTMAIVKSAQYMSFQYFCSRVSVRPTRL